MLVLRLLVMILSIICLMDGHAEVSSSTTGVRDRDVPVMRENVSKVETLDRKKKKKPKKSKKSKKPKKKKPKLPKPDEKTSTLKMSTPTITTSTAPTTSSTPTTIITTTSTPDKATTTTPVATTTISPTTSTSPTTVPTTIISTATTTKSSQATITTGAGGECKATNGKSCVFPFKDDNNKEYNKCKNKDGRYFWCATKVYESGKYMYWSYCPNDGSCPLPGDGECRATNNKPCVFPFKDGEKEYNECADYGGKYFWCATGTNSAGKYTAWSECSKDGSCPLQGQNTTPVSTSTATTAASTTTSDNIESTSTNVIVKDGDETFSCILDFTFESVAGFKIKPNISSSCSALGTRSSDKPYNNFDIHYFDIITKLGAKINCKITVILQDEESGVGMATKAMEKSLEYSIDNTECVTISGESFPASCVVPFIYEGREYQACTDKGGKDEDKIWCATAVDHGGVMTNWGYCSTACGYCGGKDVTSEETRGNGGGDCGYACFINPNKQMEPKTHGMDAKLLSPPEVYSETTMPKWNKLTNDQYQFKYGDPGVFLVCKNGFNHFPCHQSIYIKCTGNYRFDVFRGDISEDGETSAIGKKVIKSDVKNVHIGCGPCPMGFDYKVGDEEPTLDYSRGRYTVTNIETCGDLCIKDEYCNTFVFSSEENYCELNRKRVEKPSYPKPYRDYRLCTKEADDSCSIERCRTARQTNNQIVSENDNQTDRIINSIDGFNIHETSEYIYPWMVSLRIYNPWSGKKEYGRCGGSLISCRHVLTAKHCLMNKISYGENYGKYEVTHPSNVAVYVGSHKYQQGIRKRALKIYTIKKMSFPPSKYEKFKYEIDEDIAVILIENAVLNGANVGKIDIPDKDLGDIIRIDSNVNSRSTRFVVAGWGQTWSNYGNFLPLESYKYLKSTNQLKIRDPSACTNLLNDIGSKEICAQVFLEENPAMFCKGDSGGPGMVQDSDGKWYVHAVVNRGYQDCPFPGFSIMANVFSHREAILKIMDGVVDYPWTTYGYLDTADNVD